MYFIEILSIDCVQVINKIENPETVYVKAKDYMYNFFSSGVGVDILDGEYIASLCSDNGEKKLYVLNISIVNGVTLVL